MAVPPRRSGGYTFGDDDAALARLALVSARFDPSSHAFLTRLVPPTPKLVVDLGCGPGHTTTVLARATGARSVIGLDTSEGFLAAARAGHGGPRVRYRRHDVTRLPLPVTEAPDLLYCRLLLAHLPDPVATLGRWATQLAPGGVLALDELEFIAPVHPVLADYEEVVVWRVGTTGGLMYAGPLLASAPPPAGCDPVDTTVVEVPVPAPAAAAMFRLNLRVWGHDPAVLSRFGAARIERLAAALDELAAEGTDGDADCARWGLRQLAYRRRR